MVLEEIEGVVSVRSFEMLLQWLHIHAVGLEDRKTAQEHISALIELSRFADMCSVDTIESYVTTALWNILITNPGPVNYDYAGGRDPDTNTHCLMSQHIESASHLPDGHSVRMLLAQASVEGYLCRPDYKFLRETQGIPNYASDLLLEVRKSLRVMGFVKDDVGLVHPLPR